MKFSRFSLSIFLFLVILWSCKKEEKDEVLTKYPPVLSTTAVTSITQTTAVSGGNITSNGGSDVSARGVCWSTSQSPTVSDNKTSDGTGVGAFSSNLTNLKANTTYYVRAYATNAGDTGYGASVSFKTN